MKVSRSGLLMFMFTFMAGVFFLCYSLIMEDIRPLSSRTYSTTTYSPVVIPEPESSYSSEIVTSGEKTFENVISENNFFNTMTAAPFRHLAVRGFFVFSHTNTVNPYACLVRLV